MRGGVEKQALGMVFHTHHTTDSFGRPHPAFMQKHDAFMERGEKGRKAADSQHSTFPKSGSCSHTSFCEAPLTESHSVHIGSPQVWIHSKNPVRFRRHLRVSRNCWTQNVSEGHPSMVPGINLYVANIPKHGVLPFGLP